MTAFEQVWRQHGYGQSALVERSSGRLIGRAGLHPWPNWNKLELGYTFAREWWGQGLAREASQVWLQWAETHLPHDHLIAAIQPANISSIKLAGRLGFTLDRHDVTPRGAHVAIYHLQLQHE